MNRIRTFTDTPMPPPLPRPAPPAPAPTAFFVLGMPADPTTLLVLQHIYRLAFEQAQAVCRPSLPERDLLGYWN